jgi:hypothetical protein
LYLDFENGMSRFKKKIQIMPYKMRNFKPGAQNYPKWKKFTEAMEKVVNREHKIGYAIIWTDEQLLDAVNELLEPEDRLSLRTLHSYKAGEIKDDEIAEVFASLYKKALREQSENLFSLLQSDVPGGWQRYAWILERKFDEWNMTRKEKVEVNDLSRLVFKSRSEK